PLGGVGGIVGRRLADLRRHVVVGFRVRYPVPHRPDPLSALHRWVAYHRRNSKAAAAFGALAGTTRRSRAIGVPSKDSARSTPWSITPAARPSHKRPMSTSWSRKTCCDWSPVRHQTATLFLTWSSFRYARSRSGG